MMRVLVTGGCGFIGSNFTRFALKKIGAKVLNIDKQTYAGQGRNLEHMGVEGHPDYTFVNGDICDKELVERVFSKYEPEWVFNFAAESHVDRSIEGSEDFVMSNVLGAANIFDAALKHKAERVVQISTDEVYGSRTEGSFSEKDSLNPSSPYSASKAAADLLALSYFKTHNLPVVITRSANNYGPYQFPEKILPLFITNLIDGNKIPLMWSPENPGLNVRDWLHVDDNCWAIWLAAKEGRSGEIYNIPGDNKRSNIALTRMLLEHFGKDESMIERVSHRKGHDFRYSITGDKIKELGFEHRHRDLNSGIAETANWYEDNQDWWGALKK